MVGDPMQLSAIIFSDKAKKAGYGTSLFERLSCTGHTSVMLDTQYRMDPIISAFASKTFYNSNLKDGNCVLIPNFRPSYLNGINTKNGFQYENSLKDPGSVNGSENIEKVENNASSTAASFLSSLNALEKNTKSTAPKLLFNNKSNIDIDIDIDINDSKNLKKNIDDLESSMTLKPFLFFDLVTSLDVSNATMSHSNIGR